MDCLYLQQLLINKFIFEHMEELREKFKLLRSRTGFTQSSFNGIMSRHTVKRFEDGGDITLSKIVDAVEKMGKKVLILV